MLTNKQQVPPLQSQGKKEEKIIIVDSKFKDAPQISKFELLPFADFASQHLQLDAKAISLLY